MLLRVLVLEIHSPVFYIDSIWKWTFGRLLELEVIRVGSPLQDEWPYQERNRGLSLPSLFYHVIQSPML